MTLRFRPLLGPNLPVKVRKPGQFLNPRFVAWPLPSGLGTHNPRFVVWPLELGLGTHNPRFVAWPLELGSGTHNPGFVAWPLELGLGTHNPRFFAWSLELGLGTHKPRFVVNRKVAHRVRAGQTFPLRMTGKLYRGGGDFGRGEFRGEISPLRKVAKFPPSEIFAVWDPGFFLVCVPPFGGGYLRIIGLVGLQPHPPWLRKTWV